MLAKRRNLKVGQAPPVSTPLLLPSFSSKGFPRVAATLKAMEEYISDEVLVSAYDLHYRFIKPPFDFASTIFLDSGGYEASKDSELSETFEGEHIPKGWTAELYAKVVKAWSSNSPTVFVSFDHPRDRLSIADQIERAKKLRLPNKHSGRALLIKPESKDAKRLHLKTILPAVRGMTDFAVIGVTEKEIGNSILDRMRNIAILRAEVDRNFKDLPIHIFGSLDTLSTYLYFLAGADIFDGLTWLRYAFFDGDTIYRHNFGTLTLPISTNSEIVEGRCWSHNYQYMQQMRLNMRRFTVDGDFTVFGKYHERIKAAYESMAAELAGD
ncbi:MAG: hypothetical protein WCE79_03520 [Xanthobacteraceae bacterium]